MGSLQPNNSINILLKEEIAKISTHTMANLLAKSAGSSELALDSWVWALSLAVALNGLA